MMRELEGTNINRDSNRSCLLPAHARSRDHGKGEGSMCRRRGTGVVSSGFGACQKGFGGVL
jgi:hypothetical protein